MERPLRPLDKTVAVLNMDMIGRNMEVPVGGGRRFNGLEVQSAESNSNSVNIIGHSRSPALSTAAVKRANTGVGLVLKMDLDNNASNLLRRSNQWPFLQRGVPAIWFHTGLHPDYHTANDRPEKINYDKMEKIARLVHQVSWDLAQQPARPRRPAAALSSESSSVSGGWCASGQGGRVPAGLTPVRNDGAPAGSQWHTRTTVSDGERWHRR